MAVTEVLELQGGGALIRAFKELNVSRSEMLKVERKAAKLMVKAARARVPVNTGSLKRSIKSSALRGEPATIVIRPDVRRRVSKKGLVTTGWYAYFVEYGLALRHSAKDYRTLAKIGSSYVFVTNFGIMPAQPFMRPAWDATKAPMAKMVERGAWTLVDAKAKEAGW